LTVPGFLEALQDAAYNPRPFPAGTGTGRQAGEFNNATIAGYGPRSGIFVVHRFQAGSSAVSSNVLADAARRSFSVLLWQVACVAGLAAVVMICWGVRAGLSALAGGGIGLIWTVYMALTLFRHSLNHGMRMSAGTFLAGWLIKVALTVALLIVAFRSDAIAPPALLAGLAGALVAYGVLQSRRQTRSP
jgi:ATP synthase protein I